MRKHKSAEERRPSRRAYYLAHAEEIKRKAHEWYEANKERATKRQHERYEANKEKRSIAGKEWIEKNRERYTEYHREYQRTPERKAKMSCRAKSNYLKKRYNIDFGPCSRCGSNKNIEKHHPDHSQPFLFVVLCSQCHAKETRREKQRVA